MLDIIDEVEKLHLLNAHLEISKLIKIIARDMEKWTSRADDAKRIPDVLMDYAEELKHY